MKSSSLRDNSDPQINNSFSLDGYIISSLHQLRNNSFLPQYAQAEVFFSLKASSENPDEPALPLQMEIVHSELGASVLLFTCATDSRLFAPFASLPLIKAVEMVRKIPQAQGLILQSSSTVCIQINQAGLESIFRESSTLSAT